MKQKGRRKITAKALEYMTKTKLFIPFFMAALLIVFTPTSKNSIVSNAAIIPRSFISA